MNTKRIYLENAFNIRDLGGFQADDKMTVRWNVLFRSDALFALNENDWQILIDKNVKTVIDLRSLSETEYQKDCVPEGIAYRHCPLQKEDFSLDNAPQSAQHAFGKSLTQGYKNIVNENMALLAAALNEVLAGLKEGAVLFHCTAGKDRTGVLAAVIYFLMGVCEEDIIADYQVSYTYNKKGVNKMIGSMPELEVIKPLLLSEADSMADLLEYFKQIDIIKLLAKEGFTEECTQTLKKLVLQ